MELALKIIFGIYCWLLACFLAGFVDAWWEQRQREKPTWWEQRQLEKDNREKR